MSKLKLGLIPLAVVIGMSVWTHLLANSPASQGNVTEAKVAAEAAEGNNWLINGRTYEAQHFSPLKQIDDQNAGKLGLAWYLDVDSAMGIVAEPLVVDG